jgi:WS/DGAT/MGAT family acyltransferase
MAHHPMSSADAAWLHMDRPTNLMVINAVLWFDEPLDWARVKDVFQERVIDTFPRFRQRVVERRPAQTPAWEDDPSFDAALHFHRLRLPAPGDRGALQELVNDLITAPLDRTKPLWHAYLLEGYGSGDALLMRMHHSIADGIALARVMLSLTDLDGEPVGFQPDGGPDAGRDALAPVAGLARPLTRAAAAGRAAAATLAHESVETLAHPRHAAEIAKAAGSDARTLVKLLVPAVEQRTALKGEQRAAHRAAWADPVSLRSVKRTGHALGATVNDVLVAAVAGAIGRHLDATGTVPDELHAMVPFNLRPLDQPLPRELGNRFGLVLLGLPVGIRDPAARLQAVRDSMRAIKDSHEGALAYGVLGVVGRTPAPVEELLVDFFSAKATMVLTNVPGPQHVVSLAGTPVRGVLVWAPCSGSVGLSVSVFSYAGQVTAGFLTDAGLVPDPQALADDFRREVLALGRCANATPVLGRHPAEGRTGPA